ncbi:4-hydroxy-tetrahydrodipicolinate synthase [Streptomyces silvisoli]|uniref:4-hydroxy-tetrahydrodipicolinate synthase n=1 Tax=Streptomyces silvisoli TaxID=3034235 RepID=A0ABT5ZSG6_9ACTN|nr:4-hydroxy-tetrahydrodipicolinate synthase [Streptomyces silvisoli]MDF3292773.1 4-hydroxy-tetrahydrodipicolinate synthase [Streptomyces silvisoli]
MENSSTLTGIHVPLVTPFTADGSVAYQALEALAHQVLDEGADGLVALGTTGEPATLDEAERRAVIDVIARVCGERAVPLSIGAGTNDTRTSAAALHALKRWPEATAALVSVPYFTRPSEEGVLAHFEALAAESHLPLVVYNVPYRSGQSLSAHTLRRLAVLPQVVGVKHAVGAIDAETIDLLADLPDGFAVLAGDDIYLSGLLALGGAGGILASAHCATARYAELATAWQDGDLARARRLGGALSTMARVLFAEPSPGVLKGVLHAQGRIPTPAVRLPMLPASPQAVEAAMLVLGTLADQ